MSSTTGDGGLAPARSNAGTRAGTWSAYALTLLLPGTGHVSAGHWKRGLAWVGTYVVAAVFLGTGALLAGGIVDPVAATRIEAVRFVDVAFPLAVLVLCAIDLYALSALSDAPA